MSTTLERWRGNPTAFVETHLFDAKTGRPFKLLDAEKQFLKYALMTGEDGRPLFPELLFGAIRKSGKTTFAAIFIITVILLFGPKYAEAIIAANDEEQAQSRIFEAIKRIVIASPLLSKECLITQSKITFESTKAFIVAIASGDPASAAGHDAMIVAVDEPWGITTEKSRRRFEELAPPPTQKMAWRLCVSYAGFSGESQLLEEMYRRGTALPEVGESLHAGDGMLCAWHTKPISPWQTERWLNEMRKGCRPNQYARIYQNAWVTSESSFIDLEAWDACVERYERPVADRSLPIWCGVDASVKRDSTAIVGCTYDHAGKKVRLCFHRTWQPSVAEPLNFAATVEQFLLEVHRRFRVMEILYDPYQLAAVMQNLTKQGLPCVEYPQTVGNLTAASQCLYELIQSQGLAVYPDARMRTAVSQAVAVEGTRGWKISKAVQSHRVDMIVAMAMSAWACARQQGEPRFDLDRFLAAYNDDGPDPNGQNAFRRQSMFEHVLRSGGAYAGAGSRVLNFWNR